MDQRTMEREVQQANASLCFYDMRAARVEDQVFLSHVFGFELIAMDNVNILSQNYIFALQLNICSEQIQKLADDKLHSSLSLENTQKKLLDVKRLSQQARESLEELQSKVDRSRAALVGLQIELERERYGKYCTSFLLISAKWQALTRFSFFIRFDKKRIEEELEVVKRKASRLRAETEGSSVVEKLQEELREYREILKCSICLERTKEVNI
jgi:E3 ubiquitin-protein ligase BRE1